MRRYNGNRGCSSCGPSSLYVEMNYFHRHHHEEVHDGVRNLLKVHFAINLLHSGTFRRKGAGRQRIHCMPGLGKGNVALTPDCVLWMETYIHPPFISCLGCTKGMAPKVPNMGHAVGAKLKSKSAHVTG